jgi:hypothetical protein
MIKTSSTIPPSPFKHHKIFTWSHRSRWVEEINQKGRFWSNLRFFAERLDMSVYIIRQVRKNLLEFSVEVGHIWWPKPDTLILTGMRIKMNLGKTWGADRNKMDIDIVHIWLYQIENGVLDIAMSFQFMHLWTRFDDLCWEKNTREIWSKREVKWTWEASLH